MSGANLSNLLRDYEFVELVTLSHVYQHNPQNALQGLQVFD